MTKIIFEVTEEELERLDSIGIFSPDMAGVLWQKVTITPVDKKDVDDLTHMFDGVTAEMCKNALKGWTSEELRSKIRTSGEEFLEEVGGEIGSSCEKFIRQMTGNEGGKE